MTIFINGKQKRVKRPTTLDGIAADEFIRNNADPLWLFQNGMYEELYRWEQKRDAGKKADSPPKPARDFNNAGRFDDDLPF